MKNQKRGTIRIFEKNFKNFGQKHKGGPLGKIFIIRISGDGMGLPPLGTPHTKVKIQVRTDQKKRSVGL